MRDYSDDFRIVRYYVWYNFIAQSAPITPESLTVEDVVALITDIGMDWRDKSKRGYKDIPPFKGPFAQEKECECDTNGCDCGCS